MHSRWTKNLWIGAVLSIFVLVALPMQASAAEQDEKNPITESTVEEKRQDLSDTILPEESVFSDQEQEVLRHDEDPQIQDEGESERILKPENSAEFDKQEEAETASKPQKPSVFAQPEGSETVTAEKSFSGESADASQFAEETQPPEVFDEEKEAQGELFTQNGEWYYRNADGFLAKDTWVDYHGERFFAGPTGAFYRNRIITFGSQISNYMGDRGQLLYGRFYSGEDGYFADETGNLVKEQWVEDSENRYFPNALGVFYRDRFISFGEQYQYYLYHDGHMARDAFVESGSDLYYVGDDGLMNRGNRWLARDGKDYFPNKEGKLYRDRIITFGSEEAYYMQHDGSKATNTIVEVENHLYYLRGDGRVAQDNAWITVDGKDYFPNKEGKLYRDRIITFGTLAYYMNHAGQKSFGAITGNGAQYFADRNTGLLYSDVKVTDQDGQVYYLLPNYQMARGWRQIDRRLYYFDPEADFPAALRGTKKNIYNVVYEFNSEGQVINNSAIEKAIVRLDQTGWNLRLAFDWVASFRYKKLAQRDPSPGLDWFANIGFDTQTGNCFVYASTFYELARLMNYDVRWMFGYVANHKYPHSWTEIILDGNTYVFDPDFTSETGRNGYQIQYGDKGTWRYVDYNRFS
ncbi:MAG: transglutaminase domain-containing protein [Peptoniphilaceae bacterium]|nr:transglutaminase domain-containing protein [Peptoniphilaceae bacterium]MDY5765617.1 transglutaminase domain-containing protein [Peptoniphilaceae bacterium]